MTINPNLEIEDSPTRTIKSLFAKANLKNTQFMELLDGIIDSNTAQKTRHFLDLAFDIRTSEKQISDNNPLKYFTIYRRDKRNNIVPSYIQCEFKRIFDHEKVAKVLVIFHDTTNNINIYKSLRQRSKSKIPVEYFKPSNEPNIRGDIQSFIEEGILTLRELEILIRKNADSQSQFRENLQYISRINQKLKSEAIVVNYEPLVSLTNTFEDQILQLQKKTPLRKADFHGLIPHVNAIKKSFKILKKEIKPTQNSNNTHSEQYILS